MPSIERGFCSHQDYETGEQTRIMPEDLILGGLYVAMLALGQPRSHCSHRNKAATKALCTISGVAENAPGLALVKFDIMDEHLMTEIDVEGNFKDGYWADASQRLAFCNIPVISGYFKNYDDPFELEVTQLFASQSVPILTSV